MPPSLESAKQDDLPMTNAAVGIELDRALFDQPGLLIRRAVSGRKVTTVSVGGPIERLIEVFDLPGLVALLATLRERELSFRVIGAGSNLLIPDNGITDPVITLGAGFREPVELNAGRWLLPAGGSLMTLSRTLSAAGWSGLEFAGGIPASVGGAVRMNAGAHGGAIGERIESVSVLLPTGEIQSLTPAELQFDYRHTKLPEGCIVTSATVRLVSSDPATTMQTRAEYLASRKRTQPLTLPSFGSVFRNPSANQPAGVLLEQARLKGTKIGGAAVSTLHANWIVNESKDATASDITALIACCQQRVADSFGVQLCPEVVRW
jgi:UDP-N-acetylmuramate dehydrogenase